jgi:hypothetical protein
MLQVIFGTIDKPVCACMLVVASMFVLATKILRCPLADLVMFFEYFSKSHCIDTNKLQEMQQLHTQESVTIRRRIGLRDDLVITKHGGAKVNQPSLGVALES